MKQSQTDVDPQAADAIDAALMSRIVAGDRRALSELYERHANRLYRLAARILRDDHEAEDLVHDVFLEAWRTANSFEPRRGSVRTWLLVRMRSRALDRRSSARVRRTLLGVEVDAMASEQSQHAIDVALLRRAMRELEHGRRDLLELAFVRGFTMRELAHKLGIPIGTVKSRVAAGLSNVRRGLWTQQAA